TMAVLHFDIENASTVKAAAYWAGDSRCYALTPSRGLMQLTKDDLISTGDALVNLRDDSPLSNCISLDNDFTVNFRPISNIKSAMVICATDGAFGYLPTPMHFEYYILKTLAEARSIDDWKTNLARILEKYAADDVTFVLYSFEKDFDTLQNQYRQRLSALHTDIDRIDHAATDKLSAVKAEVWEKYKANYYP
ncbi:MAG TPA: hypothetical protein PLR06_13595, partial [Cyclobacteriaceae bacterium]|nr:hypothetical protein [Cyclobacteriaceae bacterium]